MIKERHMVLIGRLGSLVWWLHPYDMYEVLEDAELIEGVFYGKGLTGWFRDNESDLWIKVVNGRTSGQWVTKPEAI